MRYKCRTCGKEFDLFAWQETITNYYPQLPFSTSEPSVQVYTNYSTSDIIKTPICPFCKSLEIEEVKK